jgi:hypothetical protein
MFDPTADLGHKAMRFVFTLNGPRTEGGLRSGAAVANPAIRERGDSDDGHRTE